LVVGNLLELTFQGFGNASMKHPTRLTQQRAVCGILHQGVLEQVSGMRRHDLSEQQTGGNETV
jgi:hypothetical protein